MKELKTVCDGGDDGEKILTGKNKADRDGRLAWLQDQNSLTTVTGFQSLASYKISKAYFSTG